LINRFAGSCQSFGNRGDGGRALDATLSIPFGLAVSRDGTVFIADTGNNRVRRVTPNGTIQALAGSGLVGFADGLGGQAMFSAPTALALDTKGNLYVADTINQRIREVAGVTL
jgi:sugar lactone lactonase YvrE